MIRNVTATKTPGADFDAIVIGGGFGGLYAVHKLRNDQGLHVKAYDNASDVGGTWYWNRYPGALSDTESFCYRFSFDKELLDQGSWQTRYLTQPEILEYLNNVADRFDLRSSYQFNTKIVSTRFDEATGLWHVVTDKGETASAKYLITGLGLLSAINKPTFCGIDDYAGDIYHTGAWPEGVDLSGKRVGIIGTGSTGIQVIIALAPQVKHLTVFQRSAQYVVPIGNWPEDTETIDTYKANYDEIWKQIKSSNVAFGFVESTVAGIDVPEAERECVFEEAWQRGGGFRFMFETFNDVAISDEVNTSAANFIKRKIAKIVKDPEIARKLTPGDIYAKRPLCATDYYGVYNRKNVSLADVKDDPIAEFTTRGIRLASGIEHELDAVIFATGFDAVDGNYTKIDIRGRGGVTIRDKWADGPLGYLGMMEADFPNMFMILGPNGPFTNLPPSIESQVEWISDTIATMEADGRSTIEPTQEAEDAWVETCRTIANMTLFPKAESWIFGANIPGKKNAVMFYLGGLGNYRSELQSVRNSGYESMIFDRQTGSRRTERNAHPLQREDTSMREPTIRARALAGIAAVCALGTAPAMAQTAPQTAADEVAPGEIVVTATKRAESLQSVPISVSAIGGDALSKSRVTSVDSLVTKVANLQLTSIVGDNTPIFALRGVSMSDYSLNQSSPVATYYDEVYKGNFAFLGLAMYDLERVEVLRGPQGTLYGKNTTGGAVNIISRDAKLGETSGYINAGYGNYNRVDLNGAVNVPLGEKAALRVAGTFARADGWFKNVVPGMPDLASTREWGVRGTLKVEPTDGVKLTLRASHSFQNPQNYGIYAQPEAINRPGLTKWQIASDVPDRRRAKTTSVAFTANIDVADGLAITSITSYDKGTLFFREDTDGTATRLLEIPYYDKASQFAQDLRLTSNFGGPFEFILGAYFNREKVYNQTAFEIRTDLDVNEDGVINAADCAAGFPAACKVRNQFDQVKKSFAVYSDLKYKVTDAVTLRGGLRFTHDTGVQSGFSSDAFGYDNVHVLNLIPLSTLRFKTDNLSGKIGFDYKLPGGDLLYASVSRGYRAPSFNAQAFFDPSELSVAKAEKVTSYEVGAKTQFWDRRITLNMAAFYYDYRNQQFINVDPVLGSQTLLNIPKSRIFGGEAELTVRASDRFTLHAGMGLLSTKIKQGTLSGNDVAGHRLSNAPTFTFNAGIDATLYDGGIGKVSVHPEIAYQSSQFFEVLNIPRLRQSSYALVGGHIDWESANGMFNASVWAKNLANKFYFTSRVDLLAGFGFDYNHIGNPRSYGVTVGAKF